MSFQFRRCAGDPNILVDPTTGTSPIVGVINNLILDTVHAVMCRHDGTVWQPVSKNYYANDIGTANTISLVLVPQPASWNDLIGKRIAVKIAASNTGATTIAVAGCAGTKAVKKSVSTVLAANDLLIGGIYEFVYDGTNVQLSVGLKGDIGETGAAGADGKETFSTIAKCTNVSDGTTFNSPFVSPLKSTAVIISGTLNGVTSSGIITCSINMEDTLDLLYEDSGDDGKILLNINGSAPGQNGIIFTNGLGTGAANISILIKGTDA